jgi:hypothetical protein
MIKKVILAVSVGLALGACSQFKTNDNDTNIEPLNNPPTIILAPGLTTEEVTDKSMCSGPTPAGTTPYSNKWFTKTRVSNGYMMTLVYDLNQLNQEGAVITLSAEKNGVFVSLFESTSLNERENKTLEFGFAKADSGTFKVEGEPFRFGFDLPANTAKYSFAGPCLVLTDSKRSITLAPFKN